MSPRVSSTLVISLSLLLVADACHADNAFRQRHRAGIIRGIAPASSSSNYDENVPPPPPLQPLPALLNDLITSPSSSSSSSSKVSTSDSLLDRLGRLEMEVHRDEMEASDTVRQLVSETEQLMDLATRRMSRALMSEYLRTIWPYLAIGCSLLLLFYLLLLAVSCSICSRVGGLDMRVVTKYRRGSRSRSIDITPSDGDKNNNSDRTANSNKVGCVGKWAPV